MYDQWFANQIARCQFHFKEPLSAHTSIKIGGPASIFVVPQSIDTLLCCIQQLDFLSPRIIGNGTNVIAPDEGIDCVIKTSQLTSTVVKDNTIESECGTPLRDLCKLAIRGRMRRIMKQRFESQPLDFPSAGSVFKRPTETFYVGKAIEDLGLKGYAIGGAEISKKHAGFIINRGGATAEDVKRLISCIQQKVYTHFGVLLEPEVILW